ncbi:hypothetical protein ACFFRR_011382 [Megaselia abdita]
MSFKLFVVFATLAVFAQAHPGRFDLPEYNEMVKNYPTGPFPTPRPDAPFKQDPPLRIPEENRDIFKFRAGAEQDKRGPYAHGGIEVPVYENGRHSLNGYAKVEQGLGGDRGWNRNAEGGTNYKYNFG